MANRIVVHIRLDNPLNGAHGHWSVQAAKRRQQREAVQWAWIQGKMPLSLEDGQRVKLIRRGKRALDSDNLQASLKSVRDAAANMLQINDRLDVWDYGQQLGEYAVIVEIVG